MTTLPIQRQQMRDGKSKQGFDIGSEPSRTASGLPTWLPIETAPKDGAFILLHVPGGALESGPVTIGNYWRYEDRDPSGKFKKGEFYPADWRGWLGIDADAAPSWCEPTHWMPLPAPPTEQEAHGN